MSESIVHEFAICESSNVGAGTRIWAFAHVLPDAKIGADCNICDGVFIENDVVIGDRVTIKGGVQIWDGIRLGDDVFIGPNATFTNDLFPRSRAWQKKVPITTISEGASIGANATILPGVTVGRNAMVGAGAVVTHDVPPNAIVWGNPAQIHRYVDAELVAPTAQPGASRVTELIDVALPGGARVTPFTVASDLRGSLTSIEFESQLPFVPRRFFTVFAVPSTNVRGEHAHRQCHQYLVALCGSVSVVLDDGLTRSELVLDHPGFGLHIPPLVWGIQYRYAPGTVLGVFASEPYDPDEYIREYEEFLRLTTGA